jgi:hypothetical protein
MEQEHRNHHREKTRDALHKNALILIETRAFLLNQLRIIYTAVGRDSTDLSFLSERTQLFLDEIAKTDRALHRARLGIQSIDQSEPVASGQPRSTGSLGGTTIHHAT